MPLRSLLCFALLGWSAPAFCASVIFLTLRHHDGRPVELEKDGRYAHVAISYRGLWFHAHPSNGVELVDNIENYGEEYVILEDPSWPEPSPEYVQRWLGRPFDFTYSWANEFANYCSRLVGVSVKAVPEEMLFLGSNWKDYYYAPAIHDVGLSPDDIYDQLKARGWTEVHPCAGELHHANTNSAPGR